MIARTGLKAEIKMDGSGRVQIDGWRVNSMMKEADPISRMLKRSPASPQAPHQSLPRRWFLWGRFWFAAAQRRDMLIRDLLLTIPGSEF